MPELPEVETIVRANRDALVGRRIVRFVSHWPRQVSPGVARVQRALRGRTITALFRRAKFIGFELDDGGRLFVHLRMSGSFGWADRARSAARATARGTARAGDARTRAAGAPAPSASGDSARVAGERAEHVRAFWELDDGRRLLFFDARKFGRIIFTRDPHEVTGKLGVEPLDSTFTPAALAGRLRARRRSLKPLLLDQAVIAGLGNIYTDEALHRAGLHPLLASDALDDHAIRRLHGAIRSVLREGIRRNGTTLDWIYPSGRMQDYLRVYGRTGQACTTCGGAIVALRVAQRGTHICPRCQPARPGARRANGRAAAAYAS